MTPWDMRWHPSAGSCGRIYRRRKKYVKGIHTAPPTRRWSGKSVFGGALARLSEKGSCTMVQVDGRFPPRPAISRPPAGKHPDTRHQQTLKDGLVLIPAGHQIKKPPFDQISRPMTGDQPIAVVASSNFHRQLRPSSVNWPSGSFRSAAVVRMAAPKVWRPAAIGWGLS